MSDDAKRLRRVITDRARVRSANVLTAAQSKFHTHLDDCRQCRENPFGLCSTGSELLRAAGGEIGHF